MLRGPLVSDAAAAATDTRPQVVMKLRSDSSEKPLSGLIDAAAERKIEQKFAQSLQFLNQFRTNLLEEHPRFDKNEAILKDFIRNSKVRMHANVPLAESL